MLTAPGFDEHISFSKTKFFFVSVLAPSSQIITNQQISQKLCKHQDKRTVPLLLIWCVVELLARHSHHYKRISKTFWSIWIATFRFNDKLKVSNRVNNSVPLYLVKQNYEIFLTSTHMGQKCTMQEFCYAYHNYFAYRYRLRDYYKQYFRKSQ